MTHDSLISGKTIILSDEEKEAGEKFHESRYPFAWIKGALTFNPNDRDNRDHQHWLLEDFGISIPEFEETPRGYMLQDRIQLFIGSSFSPINAKSLDSDAILILIDVHHKRYNSHNVAIYNGVKIGKIGEIWEPLERVTVDNSGTQKSELIDRK